MNTNLTCYGDSVYKVTLHKKSDYLGKLSQTSEFFYESRLPGSDLGGLEYSVLVTGADLSSILDDMHNSLGCSMYVSKVEYVGEIAVYAGK